MRSFGGAFFGEEDNADLLIAFVEEGKRGGAMTALKYAEKRGIKIINLAN